MEFSARPDSLHFLTLVLCVMGQWSEERAASGVGVCCPAERKNDVTHPCSTIGLVDVSEQSE